MIVSKTAEASPQDASRLIHAPAVISGEKALRSAAVLWFFVTVIGQWVFLYYIVAFYGGPTISGDFEAWNTNPLLRKGYVAGDVLGNLAFASHVLLAAVIVFGGTLQLIPYIRARAIPLHRWNGRLFLLASIAASIAGLYMVWVRGAGGSVAGSISISFNAMLILIFAGVAWRAALRRDVASHRRWALRTFMAANGVFFIRIGVFAWAVLNGGQISELAFHVFDFASYLLPLAVLELYLRAKESGGSRTRYATASALVTCTAYMCLGTFAFYMFVTQQIMS